MTKIHDELQFFKVILSSIVDGVFTVDSSRIITSFNPAAEKITGIPAYRAIGKYCHDIFHSDICENCPLDKTMHTGVESIDRRVNILNSSGEKVPISISTAILEDESGEILGAVETFRDLSAIEQLRKELHKKYSFEDIISKNPYMHKLFAILPDIAESESTVLIQGPSGSGKELLALAIHNLSPRQANDYVVINCGTLPSQLFESELFGYTKGAFTDAKKDKKGKVSAADKGTLFFDEIGELPLSTQVKLLRLLQQREYEPLGSAKPEPADIRIIAATNKNLKELVAQGKFRDDLYFRLAVVKLDLPPLKNRREDVPYLVDHFIKQFNARKGKSIVSVTPEVMDLLLKYDFPGNIRELENIIEYAFVVCRDNVIDTNHLPAEFHESSKNDLYLPEKIEDSFSNKLNERSRIQAALKKHNGKILAAAKELGIHRTTLWRKLKYYNIDISESKQQA